MENATKIYGWFRWGSILGNLQVLKWRVPRKNRAQLGSLAEMWFSQNGTTPQLDPLEHWFLTSCPEDVHSRQIQEEWPRPKDRHWPATAAKLLSNQGLIFLAIVSASNEQSTVIIEYMICSVHPGRFSIELLMRIAIVSILLALSTVIVLFPLGGWEDFVSGPQWTIHRCDIHMPHHPFS